jgi:hypothetical protein
MSDTTSTPKRHDNPSRDLWVASLLDPAFDHEHKTWKEARDRYSETRSTADLAALPLLPNQRPTLWKLRALSIAARSLVLGASTISGQRLNALRLALVERADGATVQLDGTITGATPTTLACIEGAALPQVKDEALQSAADEWGGVWLDELGDVVLHRMDLPPKRYIPFPLPLPSALLT